MRLFFKAQCWARYFKKVISYITSYFSQIVTELLVTIVTFFFLMFKYVK